MHSLKNLCHDSLIRNAFFLMATNFINLGLGFIFWVVAARYYTPEEVGLVSALLSAMMLIAIISTLGFPIALIYYLPRNKENAGRMINSCLTVGFVASIFFSLIFILSFDIWTPVLKPVLISLESMVIFVIVTGTSALSFILTGSFIAGRMSIFHTIKESIFGLVKILPLAFFIGFGAMGIFYAWGIGVMLAVILGLIFLSRVWKGYIPVPIFDPIIKSMASYSSGNYFAEIFYILPRLVLPIIIAGLVSAKATAYFYIAIMVASLLYGISQSISRSLLAESSDTGELWDNVGKSIKFNAMILIPGVLMFILLGKFVLNLFNPSYSENATFTLMILAVTSLPLSVNNLFISVRNAQKRVSSVVMINFAVTVGTIIMAVPLIMSKGIEGAAAAYLLANTAAAFVVIYKMKNRMEFISNQFLRSKQNGQF